MSTVSIAQAADPAPAATPAAPAAPAPFVDSLGDAIAGGKAKLELRYRYENVDQDGIDSAANASTLRTRVSYATGEWKSMTAMVEFDNVSDIGDGHYNSTRNGETTYPIVADPSGTDLNQALLKYVGLSNTVITGGRQRINLDNQRFIGSVGWRQNEQTMDSVLVEYKGIDRLTATYGYVTHVHRIFGPEELPNPNAGTNVGNVGEFAGETHLVNLKYVLNEKFTAVAYDYMLDFDNNINPNISTALSTQTMGLRFTGKIPVSTFKLGYTVEGAQQSDYKDNTTSFDALYTLAELTFGGGDKIKWEAQVGQETLGADDDATTALGATTAVAVQTPLATLHKFQGWADKFLSTPCVVPAGPAQGCGLVDTYVGGTVNVMGYGFTLVGHTYEADDTGLDYGDELNFQVSKTFAKRYTVTAKYADYKQGDAATGLTKTDTTKAWLMAEAKF